MLNVEHSQTWLVTTDTGLILAYLEIFRKCQNLRSCRAFIPCLSNLSDLIVHCTVTSKTTQFKHFSILLLFVCYIVYPFFGKMESTIQRRPIPIWLDEPMTSIYLHILMVKCKMFCIQFILFTDPSHSRVNIFPRGKAVEAGRKCGSADLAFLFIFQRY